MFSELIARLTQPRPAPLPPLDGRLALAALLVRVAKSDDIYSVEEIRRIDRIIARSFSLNPVEAARMRATAERLEHVAPENDAFAAAVCETVRQEDREQVVAALWQVAQADGHESSQELAYVHRVAEALGLSPEAEDRAHHRSTGPSVIPDPGSAD